jgi:hypothetical protein
MEQLETREFGVAQIDHHAAAFGALDPRRANGILEPWRVPFR